MNSLIIALTLLFTITVAVTLGVALGYAAINLILHAMRREAQPAPRAIAASEASSGD